MTLPLRGQNFCEAIRGGRRDATGEAAAAARAATICAISPAPACWRLGRTGCTANMTEQKINVELTFRIDPDGRLHDVVSSMAGPPPKKPRDSGDGREPERVHPHQEAHGGAPSDIDLPNPGTWRARKKQLVKEAEALFAAGAITQTDLTHIVGILPSTPGSLLRRYWAPRDAAKRASTGIVDLLGSVRRTAPATECNVSGGLDQDEAGEKRDISRPSAKEEPTDMDACQVVVRL